MRCFRWLPVKSAGIKKGNSTGGNDTGGNYTRRGMLTNYIFRCYLWIPFPTLCCKAKPAKHSKQMRALNLPIFINDNWTKIIAFLISNKLNQISNYFSHNTRLTGQPIDFWGMQSHFFSLKVTIWCEIVAFNDFFREEMKKKNNKF